MKKIIALSLSLVLCFSFCFPVFAANETPANLKFVDVPESYWASKEIYSFYEAGVVGGTSDNTFSPDNLVRRSEFCKILTLAFGIALDTSETTSFADVSPSDWFFPYVQSCKSYLISYVMPGNKLEFHPNEYAKREDIAVALVLLLGYSAEDAVNPNAAKERFSDCGDLSPELLAYISVATELGLINGYGDGTFRPKESITRAETMVLASRASENFFELDPDYRDSGELSVNTTVTYSADKKSATLTFLTEEGATIRVDWDNNVPLTATGDGKATGTYTYVFNNEQYKELYIYATKGNKKYYGNLSISNEASMPELFVDDFVANTEAPQITISGTLIVDKYEDCLTVNGVPVEVSKTTHKWSTTVLLPEGITTITIVAKNSKGQTVSVEKKAIRMLPSSFPTLTIDSFPNTVNTPQITLTGSYKRGNAYEVDRVEVYDYVNKKIHIIGNNPVSGTFSKTLPLNLGLNKIYFAVYDKYGNHITREISVTYEKQQNIVSLYLDEIPSVSLTPSVKISGHITSSVPNEQTGLFINGQRYSVTTSDRSFSIDYPLNKAGKNELKIYAETDSGKSPITTVIVERKENSKFATINIDPFPESVDNDKFTISGNYTKGEFDVAKLEFHDYVGQRRFVLPSNKTSGTFSQSVTLLPGENRFALQLTDTMGNQVFKDVEVNFTGVSSTLKLTLDYPISSITVDPNKGYVDISGNVTGNTLDENPQIFLNDTVYTMTAKNGAFTARYYPKKDGVEMLNIYAKTSAQTTDTFTKRLLYLLPTTLPTVTLDQAAATVYTSSYHLSGSYARGTGNGVSSIEIKNYATGEKFIVPVTNPSSGTFGIDIPLIKGENALSVTVLDMDALEGYANATITYSSTPSGNFYLELQLDNYSSTVYEDSITLSGTLKSSNPPAELYFNGNSVPLDSNGRFSVTISLVPGDNIITYQYKDQFFKNLSPGSLTIKYIVNE